MRSRLGAIGGACAVLVAGCGGSARTTETAPTAPPATTATATQAAPQAEPIGTLSTVTVAKGLDSPVQTIPLPKSDMLWVVEQAGRVRAVREGGGPATTVLDIRSQVSSGGERGLLALALHPRFPDDPRVFLHFSDTDGDTQVQEHLVVEGVINPAARRVLLEEDQPYSNHNGGTLAFGPDGRLYLGLGDGGSANDPDERSQNLASRLGKLLRRDVDNRFEEWTIVAYGLRNPWRFSFDPQTGDAWIGDVGQGDREEIDVFPAGSPQLNFGWDVYEGSERFDNDDASDEFRGNGKYTPPVAEYTHDDGCSVTGGVVIRDPTLTGFSGRYIYGDYCSGNIWTLPTEGEPTPRKEPLTVKDVVSFDADQDGSVFVSTKDGTIRRLVQR